MERRGFLKTALGAAAVLTLGQASRAEAAGACARSPEQTTGPFIPDDFPFRDVNEGHPYIRVAEYDADFTRVSGRSVSAHGQAIYLRGQIVDENCQPVPLAKVFVWQADDHGHYNHSEDPNLQGANPAAQLDPNFQYRGIVQTDRLGRFQVRTIKPKYYPLDPRQPNFKRTAHIHVAVMREGFKPLFTQTYFEGDILEDIQEIRRLNRIDILLGEWAGQRPTGRINPRFLPLVVNFQAERGLDAPVGYVRLAISR